MIVTNNEQLIPAAINEQQPAREIWILALVHNPSMIGFDFTEDITISASITRDAAEIAYTNAVANVINPTYYDEARIYRLEIPGTNIEYMIRHLINDPIETVKNRGELIKNTRVTK